MGSLISLLGKSLKDDPIVEVLNGHDIDVVSDFDRSHENVPDAYWPAAKSAGFQLRFDEKQRLHVVFCYIAANEGFAPINRNLIGVSLHGTFDDAEATCKSEGLPYRAALGGSGLTRRWASSKHTPAESYFFK